CPFPWGALRRLPSQRAALASHEPCVPQPGHRNAHTEPRYLLRATEHPAGISRRLKTQEVVIKPLVFPETANPKGVLKLGEIPPPPLAPGEALVRVLLSPINPSDLHMVRGRYG